MAGTKGFAVKVVSALGMPVVQVVDNLGPPATVVANLPGVPITLVSALGTPLVLYDEAGDPYVP